MPTDDKFKRARTAEAEGIAVSIGSLHRLAVVGADQSDQFVPITGEKFGKYLLVGEVALGGMAEVFLAVQQGIQGFMKVVTLKRVLPHLNESADFVKMFIDEARLSARFDHPNIVRTFEFGEHDGRYFTVMEYLAGEDLSKLLMRSYNTKRPLPLHLISGIAAQICNGLHCAHEFTDTSGRPMGLVHRDVNPANVIVTYNGEVKLIDFGVAKANASASQTLAGTIKGKLAYMSPEQILARGVDRRSDVFSTGVVLWELLTVKPLFARESEAATLYAVMNDPIPPPSKIRKDVPPELDAIVLRALMRTPADRYETSEQMREALEAFLASQPKYGPRELAACLDELFGTARAEAKRAIAQSRSLPKNISLVMKLRSEVRNDLAEQAAAVEPAVLPEAPPGRARLVVGAIIAVGALALLGVGFVTLRGSSAPHASQATAAARNAVLTVTSDPPGAAVIVEGEPTGLVTPATLTGLDRPKLAIRLEMAGFKPAAETIDLPAGASVSKQFALTPVIGRLILAGLPKGASVFVDGEEHLAGEVIPLPGGKHDVRVDVGGSTLVRQSLDTGAKDQTWELQGAAFIRR
jgi:serine/threonine-protein kinase